MRTVKRLAVALSALSMLFIGLGPLPASAGAPEVVTDSVTFHDYNPCSGEHMEITLNFVTRVHENAQNLVATTQRSGSASDGSVMLGGNDVFNINDNGVRAHFNDVWRNADTGEKFQVAGKLAVNFNDGQVKLDRFDMRCVGG